jgi:sarcosine oxidase
MIGDPGGELLVGSAKSAGMYMLGHEMLDAAQMRRRFPQFVLDPDEIALYEPRAGYLHPEDCIRCHLSQASRHGAELHFDESMTSWTAEHSGEGVTVETSRGNYRARHLILAAGAWTSKVISQLALPLTVIRKVMFWFEPRAGVDAFLSDRCPIFMWEPKDEVLFYGFPGSVDRKKGVKVAIHKMTSPGGIEECSPDSIEREIRRDDEAAVRSLIAHRIPALDGKVMHASTCMYTMTPDEHFIIEQHPAYRQVIIAAGFSGHGFKFSSVVGEILGDLAIEGVTKHDITLFNSERFYSSSSPD